jgi:2-keto-4-pentenoate hydratase
LPPQCAFSLRQSKGLHDVDDTLSRNEDEIARIAEKLIRARASGRPLEHNDLSEGPRNRLDAYRVQAIVSAHLGPVAAFKTGRKSSSEPPIMAPVHVDMVRTSPAVFRHGEFRLIGIELEVAFLVHDVLPQVDAADFADRARHCVSALAAIEIVDSRLADMDAAGPFWKLADNQVNGGLVYGQPVRDWAGIGLRSVAACLEVDGQVVVDGSSDVPGGDAFEIFCAFARTVGSHCGGLVPGQYVTTGSVSGLRFIDGERKVSGRISGLGRVEATFGA